MSSSSQETCRAAAGHGDRHEDGPLVGLRVLELAQHIAGPFAGTLLGDFGAEVVHVERPGTGDPVRQYGIPNDDGVFLWWKVTMRNKRSVTLDLARPEAHDLVRGLVQWADIVIENYRPGTLERWQLGPDQLRKWNPRVVLLRVSGFGQSAKDSNRPAFGKVAEAMSGLMAPTGRADNPPVLSGVALGDTTSGLMGAFAAMMAVYRRDTRNEMVGESIDLALFETLFRLFEPQLPVFDQVGDVRATRDNLNPMTPGSITKCYPAADAKYVVVSCTPGDSVTRVAKMLRLPEDDYSSLAQQRAGLPGLDEELARWIALRPSDSVLDACREANVAASPIYTARDIVNDDVYLERGDVVTVPDDDLGDLMQPGVVPRLDRHPGSIRRPAPRLGADNSEVFLEMLGLPAEELDRLTALGVV